jgi:hypothetical protein
LLENAAIAFFFPKSGSKRDFSNAMFGHPTKGRGNWFVYFFLFCCSLKLKEGGLGARRLA